MPRKNFDCRDWPGPCTLTISGSEDEVVETQVRHLVEAHGLADSLEVREQVRASLKDDSIGASSTAASSGAMA